ncbi:MAG: hypothetical protein AAFW68_08260, partial [Pseudomonadota bacterium]
LDGGIYHDMAAAMASNGALHIAENGGVEGAPALTKFLTVVQDGKAYPQYPSGYALLAAPFYIVFGVQGLMLMNALSFVASIWLVSKITQRFYGQKVAKWAATIFAIATFAPVYAFGIWPHMLALAVWLAAAYFALIAYFQEQRQQRWLYCALAGLLIGAGVNIRLDVFLVGLVLFFWMRLFSLPRDRISPLFLILGTAPGLLLAAWLNAQKFGAFTPFSYGRGAGGLDSTDQYTLLFIAMGSLMAVAWSVNLPVVWTMLRNKKAHLTVIIGLCAVGLFMSPAGVLLWRMMTGVYVLVFNLQAHDAYVQAGVERNEYGHLLFWGYPKKALIQSLPWAPLILLPLLGFFRGRQIQAVSLCLLSIAAPVAFYALNHWHGGGSYNMRYFFPALPFLAILAAAGLAEIMRDTRPTRQMLLMMLVGASILHIGLQEIGQANERFLAPAALYPQWVIAAALLIALAAISRRPSAYRCSAAVSLSLFALAYGLAVNFYEEVTHERTRFEQLDRARDISAPIASGALVITASPLSFLPAEANGAHVMAADDRTVEKAGEAARAFVDARRCVYFHNSYARDLVGPSFNRAMEPTPLWADSEKFSGDPRLAFFLAAGSPESCRF